MEDINRLKVVLAEKNVQQSGLRQKSAKTLQPSLNGALTQHSQVWIRCVIFPMLWR